jgi:hypothetical protein
MLSKVGFDSNFFTALKSNPFDQINHFNPSSKNKKLMRKMQKTHGILFTIQIWMLCLQKKNGS